MHCGQAERRIQWLLDERLPLACDAALGEHLAHCCECRRLAALYERIAAAFAEPYAAAPAQGAQIAGPRRRARAWSRRPAPAALAAAAALLLAFWLSAGPPADGVPHQDAAAPDPVAAAQPRLVDAAIESAAGSAAVLPAAPAGPALDDALALGAGAPAGFLVAPWDAALPQGLDRLSPLSSPWVRPVTGGFKPVTRSVEAAWGALRNTMLGPEPAARS